MYNTTLVSQQAPCATPSQEAQHSIIFFPFPNIGKILQICTVVTLSVSLMIFLSKTDNSIQQYMRNVQVNLK